MKPGHYILLGMGIVVAILIGFLVGRRCGRNAKGEPPTPRVDTLVIRDTETIVVPKYLTRRIIDSVRVPVHLRDTIMQTDTIYVSMVREQVVWEDSLARVYASGIQTQVDSVSHFTEKMVITKEIPVVRKDRWGLGIQGGLGYGKGGLTPYLGVGVSFNFITWSFTKEGKSIFKKKKKRDELQLTQGND